MLQPDALPRIHAALDAASEKVDGWLLFDFRGINPIMAAVVGDEIVGSRRAYVFVPRGRDPVALVHAVDAELWRGWPASWRRIVWVRREELTRELGALVGGKTVAMEYSPGGAVPYGDYVPAGTLELVRATGASPVSSAELVSRYCSVWSADDLAAHLRAAGILSEIAQASIRRIGERARAGDPVDEHEVTRWILEAFDRAGLVTESPPSVSYGEHAARVHYEAPAEGSSPIVAGKLLLLDLWAKEPGRIYADQTWMAAIGAPSARAGELWSVVRGARDAALDLLRERLTAGRPVAGAEADRAARGVIEAAGYGDRIVCRTGHSIDRVGLHGFGPTIDDTESFDSRLIVPGVGFSVEPGIYFPGEIGLRTEVNAHARTDGLDVTPGDYQREL
ncbi:MAG TPA: M24 family metallopeptidase, partial [Gemmatimonadales bacterium]|nr:M24 family metallopeptidase [Gemmatimonadales bacterium]